MQKTYGRNQEKIPKTTYFVIKLPTYSVYYTHIPQKLQKVLHKTVDHTTQKYRSCYAELQTKLCAHTLCTS